MNTTTARRSASTPGHRYNCNCLSCCNLDAAWKANKRRQVGYGTWQPFVDPGPAHEHISRLREKGMPLAHMAKQLGVSGGRMGRLLEAKRMRPETAEKVLALRWDINVLPDRADWPALGARRRIQALRAHGWTAVELSRRTGLSPHALAHLSSNEFVYAGHHRRIAEVYEDLKNVDPTELGVPLLSAQKARRAARRQQWAPPSAWDDIDNDVNHAPRIEWRSVFIKPEQGHRSAAVIEDTAELAAIGVPREEIVNRLGISWNAIERTHTRAGIPLPRTEAAA